MALRTFHDSAGVAWQVWDVWPSVRSITYLPQNAQETGWLAFRSGDETRRLRPVPEGWENGSEAELRRLCELATPSDPRP